jgi:hypothetical protein
MSPLDLVFEALPQVSAPIRIATSTRVTIGPRFGADEDVVLESGHQMGLERGAPSTAMTQLQRDCRLLAADCRLKNGLRARILCL